jgi:hypothetical protein
MEHVDKDFLKQSKLEGVSLIEFSLQEILKEIL